MGSYYMLSRHTLQKVIPIVLTIAFVLLLSIYNYKLYVNNYYTLFDLGVGYRLSYLFSQTFSLVGWPFPHRLVSAIPYTKMFYTVTGITLLAYDSPLTLLIDQTVVIGLGSYALYKIAEIKTGSYKIGVTFQVLYFLFPSTYGFMGQGGNFMVFLEGFLLLNYMFFLQKKWSFFIITGALGALTNSWAPGIFFILYFMEFISSGKHFFPEHPLVEMSIRLRKYFNSLCNILKHHDSFGMVPAGLRSKGIALKRLILRNMNRNTLPIAITVVIWMAIFAFEIHIYTLGGLLSSSRISAGSGGSSSSGTASLLSFFINGESIPKILYAIVQLFPLFFTSLLSLFVLPAVGYFVVMGLTTNYGPYYNLFEQYPYLYSGFLFISSVTALARLPKKKIVNQLLILMVLTSVISFALFSPFSITNVASGQLGAQIGDSVVVSNINHAYSLIPVHSSVFLQNDMPQLMNRDKVYMDGYYNNQTVDYAVMNPLALNHIMSAFSGFSLYWANHFAGNNSYGVYESMQGLIVYKLGYTGSPVYYVPYAASQPIGLLYSLGQRLTTEQLSSNGLLLSPGNFTVSYTVSNVSEQSTINHFLFTAYSESGQILPLRLVSVSESATHPGQYFVQLSYSARLFHQVSFSILNKNGLICSASLTIDSISVAQTSP